MVGPKSDDRCSLKRPCEDIEGHSTRKPRGDGDGHWAMRLQAKNTEDCRRQQRLEEGHGTDSPSETSEGDNRLTPWLWPPEPWHNKFLLLEAIWLVAIRHGSPRQQIHRRSPEPRPYLAPEPKLSPPSHKADERISWDEGNRLTNLSMSLKVRGFSSLLF